MSQQLDLLVTSGLANYELLDSGDNEKLERFGAVIVRRPDPQALWPKLKPEVWSQAQAVFSPDQETDWQIREPLPDNWQVEIDELVFNLKLSSFKHVGIFPEQVENWRQLSALVKQRTKPNVLNLFGYTGGATLACSKAGAAVCHVDGSKVAIGVGRQNAESSGLSDRPIRWMLEDAMTFVRKELKRGHLYEGIIMDPPNFGHGPGKELWKIEKHLVELLDLSYQLLSEQRSFFLLNGYAAGYSSLAYENNLRFLVDKFGGQITKGELAIAESTSDRLLPCGIFSLWQA